MESMGPALPSLLYAAAAVGLVLVVYLVRRRRGPSGQAPVSFQYSDERWRGGLRDGETVVAQAPVLRQQSWLEKIFLGNVRGRNSWSEPLQLGCTSAGALLIAERGLGRLWAIERHDGSRVAIGDAQPEAAGSPYLSVDLIVSAKRRRYFHVPPGFVSDLRRCLGG